MAKENLRLSTRAIHTDIGEKRTNRPVVTPIHLSVTYESTDYEEQIHLEETKADTFYMRYGNPTISVAERTLADLEGAEAAAVFGSGMAAITTTLFAFLSKGDHAIFQREIYGGAYRFAREFLPRWGVDVSWVDCTDTEGFARATKDNTRLLYVESPTNPTLKVLDIEAIVKIAKKHGVTTFIDSTFATPFNTRPVDYGIDGVLHSVTKYLGGHSDLVGGALVGSSRVVEKVKDTLRVLGGILNPHAAYLLIRGLKTVGVRVEQHNRNGIDLARFLEDHPRVRKVFHPHLPSHPQYDLAKRQMSGGGGVVSFEIDGDLETAKRFADALKLVRIAPSLGGVESLLSIPCLTSHAMLSPEEREKAGIRDSLVRIAFGIESSEDLMADIDQALGASG
jgi:cystathionine beta-lyase/cystathionine gamma-synthase